MSIESTDERTIKSIRATLTDPVLIEQLEQLKYDQGLTDREIVRGGLILLLEKEGDI